MSRRRVVVYYSGRVQGVGFRYTVTTVAPGYDVTGTVKNLADGRVELVAEGAEAELRDFLQGVRDSGLARFIQHEDVFWENPAGDLRGFRIVS